MDITSGGDMLRMLFQMDINSGGDMLRMLFQMDINSGVDMLRMLCVHRWMLILVVVACVTGIFTGIR
eukprot:1049312-Amorphochlora_amoeboformis.AAC.1